MIAARPSYPALILFVVTALPAALAGQRWERQVQARLDRAIDAVRGSRRLPVAQWSGMLNTEESAAFQTSLEQGVSYTILAVCDDDCTRLELTLITQTGSDLAKDRHGESLPTLQFTPALSMTYRVRVVMEACRWNPCWYAVAVVPSAKTASFSPAAGQRAPM
jgi:hypothetical protein